MNPWGALSGGGNGDYRNSIIGSATWGEIKTLLTSVPSLADTAQLKQIQSAPFNNHLHVMARQANGTEVRLDVEARLALLTADEVNAAIVKLSAPVMELELMTQEDQYYYGHKRAADLPVYRVIMDDAEQTRLYLSTTTGNVRSIGAAARTSRWLRSGLHGLDFPGLRIRPVWDIVLILLLSGVTLLCAIGSWLAIKRVRMDFRLFRNRLRRRLASRAERLTAHEFSAPE
jgi:hypothetical protein